MEDVQDMEMSALASSKYISLHRLHYRHNGKVRTWDIIDSHDSVAILIHHIEKHAFIFVKQFRPAVYANIAKCCNAWQNNKIDSDVAPPGKAGVTFELCAGIVDKETTMVEIAKQEVLEECGYNVPLDHFEEITHFRSSVGISGSNQTLFYAQVNESMKVSEGGGNEEEGEIIETVEVPVNDSIKFVMNTENQRPAGMLFAVYWYHCSKANNL